MVSPVSEEPPRAPRLAATKRPARLAEPRPCCQPALPVRSVTLRGLMWPVRVEACQAPRQVGVLLAPMLLARMLRARMRRAQMHRAQMHRARRRGSLHRAPMLRARHRAPPPAWRPAVPPLALAAAPDCQTRTADRQ
jgi:hypothetical protein